MIPESPRDNETASLAAEVAELRDQVSALLATRPGPPDDEPPGGASPLNRRRWVREDGGWVQRITPRVRSRFVWIRHGDSWSVYPRPRDRGASRPPSPQPRPPARTALVVGALAVLHQQGL